MKTDRIYKLGESTEIFFNGDTEITFRKGVWNYEEALLDLSVFDDGAQEIVLAVMRTLSEGGSVTPEALQELFGTDQDNAEKTASLLEELSEQAYLSNGGEQRIKELITHLIGGTASLGFDGTLNGQAGTLLVCDSGIVSKQLADMSRQISLPMDVLSDEDASEVVAADLTGKLDALKTEKAMEPLTAIFAPYSSVLVCMQRPHIKLLRNLNRILLRMDIPFVVCLIDGPFLSVMTIKGYETGCFECYETRVMARLESMSAYRSYVERTSGNLRKSDLTSVTPILNMIASLGLFEAFLINTIHKAKLAGRIFNIYLPLLEVQVQDLLRVPFCSACGHIAKAEYEEMYTSSEEIVAKLVEHVELSKDGE